MSECKCGLKGLSGDGCEICNPAYAVEQYKQTIEDLRTELTEANAKLAIAYHDIGCWRNDIAGCEIKLHEAEQKLSALEAQIAAGGLITPQTIHDFLDTKHDRWNPLFMRDLVEFASEAAKKGRG